LGKNKTKNHFQIPLGTIEHPVTRKSLLGKPEDLLSFADDIPDTVLHGIMVPEKKPILNVHVTMEHKNSKDV